MIFLVVEDDAVMQQIIAGMLGRLGFRSRVVSDGFEALEACAAEVPGAVLMDLQMPRMDGLTATRELRRRQREEGLPRFPIIVASAFYSPDDRAACFEAGADGFVTKPLMLAKLGAEIYRVVGRHESDAASTLRQWQREEAPATTARGG
ncbi:MAG: response regulator [Pseudomonadota bacterium]